MNAPSPDRPSVSASFDAWVTGSACCVLDDPAGVATSFEPVSEPGPTRLLGQLEEFCRDLSDRAYLLDCRGDVHAADQVNEILTSLRALVKAAE